MAASSIQGRAKVIVLPVRHTSNIARSLKSARLHREVSNLCAELRCVNEAIRALERLAGMRFPEHRRGRQAGSRA